MIIVTITKEVNNSNPKKFKLVFSNINEYKDFARNYHYCGVITIDVKTK